MKKLHLILAITVLMCSCATPAPKTSDEVVLIVHNSQPDDIMRYGNGLNIRLPVDDTLLFASYLDDSLDIKKLHTSTPLDTFKIRTSRDFLEVICRYKVDDYRPFFLKRGDTLDVHFNAQKEPIFQSRTDNNLNVGYNILLSAKSPDLKYNFLPYTLRDGLIFKRLAYLKAHKPKIFEVFKVNYIDPDTLQLAIDSFNKKYNNILADERLYPQQREHAQYYLKILDAGNRYAPELLSDDYIGYISYNKFLSVDFITKYRATKDIPSAASENGVYAEKGGENAFSMLFDTLRADTFIPPKTRLSLLKNCLATLDYNDHPKLEKHIEQYLADGGSERAANKFLNIIEYNEFNTLKLIDADGLELTLQDVLDKNRGKVVYLDYWSTSCPPCIAAMPNSQKLRTEMADEDIVFVFVALWDNKETWTKRERKIIGTEINYESYFSTNSKSRDAKMLIDFQVGSVPHYMIFNKQGKLVNTAAQSPLNPNTKKILEKYL